MEKILQQDISKVFPCYEQGLTTGTRYRTIEYLTSKEIYTVIIRKTKRIPSSQKYFENIFPLENINWKNVYILPRFITYNTYSRVFQYKLLNNILYLNKKLHLFGKVDSPKCSFCNQVDETPRHIFAECIYSQQLWSRLKENILPIQLPHISLQGVYFGTYENEPEANHLLLNHLILLFKIFIYQSGERNKACVA